LLIHARKKDHDRRIACSKGFLSSRLVAVDRDKAVVDSIKRQGKPVIHGDIFDAARAWLDATVVFADLQGGMTLGVASFMAEFCWGALAPTGGGVLAINMRRGQDTGNKLLCELVDNFPGLGECLAKSGQKDAMTNRAIIMFSAWMMCLADFSRRSTACDREAQSVYNDLQEMCDPSFLSYKSQGGGVLRHVYCFVSCWAHRKISRLSRACFFKAKVAKSKRPKWTAVLCGGSKSCFDDAHVRKA
jgi:hypothetical protein